MSIIYPLAVQDDYLLTSHHLAETCKIHPSHGSR